MEESTEESGNAGGVLGGKYGTAGFVRSGAAEVVYASNPIKLGYLTVWAAHYLLTGHHFRQGEYQVGAPDRPRLVLRPSTASCGSASRSPERRLLREEVLAPGAPPTRPAVLR
jgi:hypothetical protein